MINKIAILIFKLFLYPVVYLKRSLRISSPQIKNLLFVNTTGIGDTILSTPAWQALRKRFPDAFISLMVHERRRDVVANNPFVDKILSYRKFIYFPVLVRKVRRLHIDAAIIFHGNDPDILPLVFLCGAKRIIGYKRRTKLPYLLTTALDNLPDHFITAQMKLAEVVDGSAEAVPPVFFLTEEERGRAKLFLEKNNLSGRTLVGILPGAGRSYKRWPPQRFAALVSLFLQKFNANVIIFGSRKEAALAREIENLSKKRSQKGYEGTPRHSHGMASPRIIAAAGFLNLRQASALMEKLNLFITNDSGPLHIAIALNVPTVALFCPSDPGGLLASGENSRLKIIKKDIPCKPCITKKCRHPFCMDQISVEEVIKASQDLMQKGNLYAHPSQ